MITDHWFVYDRQLIFKWAAFYIDRQLSLHVVDAFSTLSLPHSLFKLMFCVSEMYQHNIGM